jgi:hypothetical protein
MLQSISITITPHTQIHIKFRATRVMQKRLLFYKSAINDQRIFTIQQIVNEFTILNLIRFLIG